MSISDRGNESHDEVLSPRTKPGRVDPDSDTHMSASGMSPPPGAVLIPLTQGQFNAYRSSTVSTPKSHEAVLDLIAERPHSFARDLDIDYSNGAGGIYAALVPLLVAGVVRLSQHGLVIDESRAL